MIKYHAQFLLDKEKDNPSAKLRYRIKWNGIIVAFNVGYRVDIDKNGVRIPKDVKSTRLTARKKYLQVSSIVKFKNMSRPVRMYLQNSMQRKKCLLLMNLERFLIRK